MNTNLTKTTAKHTATQILEYVENYDMGLISDYELINTIHCIINYAFENQD